MLHPLQLMFSYLWGFYICFLKSGHVIKHFASYKVMNLRDFIKVDETTGRSVLFYFYVIAHDIFILLMLITLLR